MRPSSHSCLVLLAVFLCACVGNDDGPGVEQGPRVPDFTVLGEDNANIYQYSFRASNREVKIINLTEQLHVPRQFITLRQVENRLTFYSFASDNFSAAQTDFVTGENRVFENFYTSSPERSIIWGANSDTKLFMGYYSPRGTADFGIRFIDPQSGNTSDLLLDTDTRNVYQPLYHHGRLFVPYEDEHADYKVVVLDAEEEILLKTLEFGNAIPSLIVAEDGNIVIFSRETGSEYDYTLYDIDTLEVLSTSSFTLHRFFSPGPIEADIMGGILYYLHFYAQPSRVPFGPALYDFARNENRILDMISIVEEVQSELQATLILTTFGYRPEGKTFLVGFTTEGSTLFEGGLLVISETGDLLERISLPFVPIYIAH